MNKFLENLRKNTPEHSKYSHEQSNNWFKRGYVAGFKRAWRVYKDIIAHQGGARGIDLEVLTYEDLKNLTKETKQDIITKNICKNKRPKK